MRTLRIKISVIVLKFLSVICAFAMLFHVSLLITRRLDENRIIEAIEWTISLPVAPALTAIILSKQLGFCSIHRYFIAYTSIVSYCIKFQDSIGFGNFSYTNEMDNVYSMNNFVYNIDKAYICS